jgi:nucleoside 2-deoxyribosyltransferase
VRIDKIPVSGSITTKTLEQIAKSEIVLADLTGGRPNCYYETGYAHALGKEMILTIRKRSTKHFSLSVHQFIEWTDADVLQREIMARLEKIRKRKELLLDEGSEMETNTTPIQPAVEKGAAPSR